MAFHTMVSAMHIHVTHTVEDFDVWKSGFDDHASTRMEFGGQGYQLFRTAEDSNETSSSSSGIAPRTQSGSWKSQISKSAWRNSV